LKVHLSDSNKISADYFYLTKYLSKLNISENNIEAEIKKDVAIILYDKEIYSLGKAAEFAGISKNEFMKLLREKNINIKYSIKDIEDDLDNIPQLVLKIVVSDTAPLSSLILLDRLYF
jgi:predicted HTH domain antitoxin